ncbi:MAG: MMPL family transporter, partial [Candidatus Dormibacteraeota bacterium]|nr:MMPL family transporter [Candidatus Dormibacteraeota bacterium]
AGSSGFDLVISNPSARVEDPSFRAAVDSTLARLRADPGVASLQTPYDGAGALAAQRRSRDGHRALVEVGLHADFFAARREYRHFRDEVVPPSGFSVASAGQLAYAADADTYVARDLKRAGLVAAPLALVLLLLVFGSISAALLCLVVGGVAVAGGLGLTYLASHAINVSQFAPEIVNLIGLGVGIDYSLFIVSRFREELAAGHDVETALSRAMGTAGRAILFSGMTVAVGLSALLFYRGTFLVSMGVGGALVVAVAVVYGLTLLPAALAILGPRIDFGRMPWRRRAPRGSLWHSWALLVMRRPLWVLVPTLVVLLLAGLPFARIHLANSDISLLPRSADSRMGTEQLADFPGHGQTVIDVVVRFHQGSPLDPANLGRLAGLDDRLRGQPQLSSVTSVVDPPGVVRPVALQALALPPANQPADLRTLVSQSVGREIAVVTARSTLPESSDAANQLVQRVRNTAAATPGASVYVTGTTAFNVDFVAFIVGHTPRAVAFVVISTFVILVLLLGTPVLPLKAVLMNLLSLSAAFGALVWIFQEGHLSGPLGVAPAPIDPTLPVLLFCIVFGLSMDYEVFLLTRMQEAWRSHGDNRIAVAEGLERSGRLVTGAAAIMVGVFFAFALAQVVLIKATGLGMGIAVFVDATLVRALVVPALMRLLGRANWWAPAWLRRLHAATGMAETTGSDLPTAA